MQGTIKPNRTEVSRSFPVLGFTIRIGFSPAWFEVALATDPHLLHPENREHRTPQNFYSSRSAGPLPAHGGETVYLVPPTVLSRFAGQTRLFYAVAVFAGTDRSSPQAVRAGSDALHHDLALVQWAGAAADDRHTPPSRWSGERRVRRRCAGHDDLGRR
jgi:hypothetical protein